MPRTKICFFNSNGTQVCVPLFSFEIRHRLPIPDPGPIHLERKVVEDLVILDRMYGMASKLSPNLQAGMKAQVENKLGQISFSKDLLVSVGS